MPWKIWPRTPAPWATKWLFCFFWTVVSVQILSVSCFVFCCFHRFLPRALWRFGFLARFPTKARVFFCRLTLLDFIRGVRTCRPFSFCTMIWLMTLETYENRDLGQCAKSSGLECTSWAFDTHNAFMCSQVLQNSTAGFPCVLPLTGAQQI